MITSFFAPKKGGNSNKQKVPEEKQRQNGTKRPRSDEGGDAGTGTCKRTVHGPLPPPSSALCPEAKELLGHLRDDGHGAEKGEGDLDAMTTTTTATWSLALRRHTSSPSFNRLATFVHAERERSGHRGNIRGAVYPPAEETFSALNFTPLESVRVVIVGQDPYHGYDQGHGLCFSVKRGVKTPPSLRNIYKELLNDPDVPFDNHLPRVSTATAGGADKNGKLPPPRHGNLERWARQGVLLLNSVLTVRHGEANSHAKRGWEQFTDEVIRVLDHHGRESGRGLVFLLWGKPASSKAESVIRSGKQRASASGRGSGGKGEHTVICTSHPSPLSATKTNDPFMGSRCFSRANSALVERGLDPIDWNVDDAMSTS